MDTLPVCGWQVVQEADGLHLLLSGVQGTLVVYCNDVNWNELLNCSIDAIPNYFEPKYQPALLHAIPLARHFVLPCYFRRDYGPGDDYEYQKKKDPLLKVDE